MTLSAGTRLGPYEVLAPLGAGGMGEVYRAKDTRVDRTVALKVLPEEFFEDAERRGRFEREAKLLASLNHPGVATLHSFEEIPGSSLSTPSASTFHILVMELLEGETLRGALAGTKVSTKKALDWARQIAQGLAAAHEKGIVHRDLKPENVFVTKDGRIKILDFGLAKLSQAEETPNVTNLPTATRGTEPGMVMGTLGYMSPEQVKGKPADARSDIFSFGAILYEMLSGQRAFHRETAAETISAILKEDPPELSVTNKTLPPGLERLVSRCLEKNPEQRSYSAHDLAFDLESLSGVSAQSVAPSIPPRIRTFRVVGVLLAAVLVLAAAVALLRQRGKSIESLAVLPFANGSSDPGVDYLSDGITDGLINSLSQLPNLTVMSRDAVSRHKAPEESAQAAGRDLKVQVVLKGKFIQRAQDLLITAELVDVRDNSHLWGGQFSHKLSDLQAVQEEIAEQISSKLRARLSGKERKRLTKRYTENPEAYQLYLKGRYFWEKRGEDAIKRSIDYFNQAIEKDPGYALAYAGLADAYVVSPFYSFLSPRDAIPKARAAAERALEIEDDVTRAHAALGWALWSYDWDYAAAEEEFKKAISLDPRDATPHHWFGVVLISLGRTDEAVMQIQRAREIDPFSAAIQTGIPRAYLYAHQLDRAIDEARKAPEDYPPNHARVAEVLQLKGLPEQAVVEYQKAADLSGRNPTGLLYLGLAQAAVGRRSAAQGTIDEMRALATQRYVSPAYVAQIYVALGDRDESLEWLEKAYVDRSFDLIFLGVNPMWDPLRSDPRFSDLLRRVKLSP